MKRLFTFLLMSASLYFTGCVDKDFDLGNIDGSNIGIGDENTVITIPVTTIDLNLDDLVIDTRATESYSFIDQNVENYLTFDDNWMSEDIKSALNSGKVYITAKFSPYPEGLPDATLELWFDKINLLNDPQIVTSEKPEVQTRFFTNNEIESISKSNQLNYKIYFSEKDFECDFGSADKLEVIVTLTQKGAIKL